MRAALPFVALVACSDRFDSADAKDAGAEAEASAIVDAAAEHDTSHSGGERCQTIGRTGQADTCTLFAYCGHRHFEVDCSARFTCVCSEPEIDAGSTKRIAAQPTFCESASSELASAFEAARRACGW